MLIVSGLSMLAIWPLSNSIIPFVVFVIINGIGNGGFFSPIPAVVGHVYGPERLSTALAMVVTAWGAGYMMVRASLLLFLSLNPFHRGRRLRDTYWNVTGAPTRVALLSARPYTTQGLCHSQVWPSLSG